MDYIKIDGSFVRKLDENKSDQLFVRAITDVARGMGIKTIAEFVENEDTMKLLKTIGVDYAQGVLHRQARACFRHGNVQEKGVRKRQGKGVKWQGKRSRVFSSSPLGKRVG